MVRAIEWVPLAYVADFAKKRKAQRSTTRSTDTDWKPAGGFKALKAALGADKAPIDR